MGYVKVVNGGISGRYTFPDGSFFNWNDVVYGEHVCDGTIIPVSASKSTRVQAEVSTSIEKNRWTEYKSWTNRSQSKTSDGLTLTLKGDVGNTQGEYYVNQSTMSAQASATFDKTIEEPAVFLPLTFNYNSIDEMATYTGGIAKAWIEK